MKRTLLLLPLLIACGDPLYLGGDGGAPISGRSDPAAYVRGGHPSLVVEIDVADGRAPRAGVTAEVSGAIAPLLDKPDGIDFVMDGVIPAERLQDEWTLTTSARSPTTPSTGSGAPIRR